MAIVMIMHWAEVTPELYDAAREGVGWGEDAPLGGRATSPGSRTTDCTSWMCGRTPRHSRPSCRSG